MAEMSNKLIGVLSDLAKSPEAGRPRAGSKKSKAATTKSAGKKRGRELSVEEEEEYPLPAELRAAEREPEPQDEPWPARALIFKVWDSKVNGDRDEMLCDVLRERGWTDGGGFCDPEDMTQLPIVLSGKHPTTPLPRRALWVPADRHEAKEVLNAFGADALAAKRFRVSALPGSNSACYKTYTARALSAEPFVPITFVLPRQRAELLAADKALRKAEGAAQARSRRVPWVHARTTSSRSPYFVSRR
jgi:hypothetical protein